METGKSLKKNQKKDKGIQSVRELYAKYPDEKACLDLLMYIHHGKPECVYCQHDTVYYIPSRTKYKCKKCKRQFTPAKGTIFEKTQVSLQVWFAALLLVCSHPKGVSSIQLSKELNISQPTAWFMLQKLRSIFKIADGTIFKGENQADELYAGGKDKNKPLYKKKKEAEHKEKENSKGTQGRSMKYKVPILGIHERLNNRFVFKAIRSTKKDRITEEFKKRVQLGTEVYTDQSTIYNDLKLFYEHKSINHTDKVYKDGRVTTNRVECFFGLMRRVISGTYHNISYKHIEKYFAELAFRQQYISLSIEEKFMIALSLTRIIITQEEITAFDMYKHNYSGRGPNYPKEFLEATRKRGKLSEKRRQELQAESKYVYSKDQKWKNKETFAGKYEGYEYTGDIDTFVPAGKKDRPKGSKNKPKEAPPSTTNKWGSNWSINHTSPQFDSGFQYNYIPPKE